MFSKFLPKDFNFFDLFDKQVSYAVAAAVLFKEIVLKDAVGEDSLNKMQEIEHQADEVAHDIIARLNKTFITPFDREDIHLLASQLDDVVDMINTITSRLKVYNVTGVDKNMIEFADVIEKSVKAVACAVNGLRNIKNIKVVSELCVEINRLENVGDTMRDNVLAQLFKTEKDPIVVIKMKEIYQDAETVLDVCEDVAHVVETILLKQA